MISLGLGYPTLNRYDARQLGPDEQSYYRIVTGEVQPDEYPFNVRVLVPAIARPFYRIASNRLRTWNPVAFGLLVSNSFFCASAAWFLLLCSLRISGSLAVAQLASAIFLLNFAVANLWLAGMVDSAQGCLMVALTWSLLTRRWWLLPMLGVVGGMAKQSFLPFSVIFAATWWLTMENSRKVGQWVAIAGLGVAGAVCLIAVHRMVVGSFVWPWQMAESWDEGHYGANFLEWLRDYRFWYPFVWLLPLGMWRMKRLPKPWVMAVSATVAFAIALTIYSHLAGNANRPVFNVAGPLLSLSAALLLADDKSARLMPATRMDSKAA